jgi:hypothetical protein
MIWAPKGRTSQWRNRLREVHVTSVAGFVLGTDPDTAEETKWWRRSLRRGGAPGGQAVLPPSYGLEYGADVLLLRRADGSVAAAFSARGVAPSEVVRTAEEDYRRNGERSA